MKRPTMKKPILNWFKTRRSKPFVLPVQLTRVTEQYVYPASGASGHAMRHLRNSPEAAYFETKAEAWRHVHQQQGKNDEQRSGDRA